MKKKHLKTVVAMIIILTIIAILIYQWLSVPPKIRTQAKLEEQYLAELSSGNYTSEQPLIIQNPYNSNQLAAYVGFESEEEVSYSYTVEGTIPFSYSNEEYSNDVIIPVVGLYNDQVNTVEIQTINQQGQIVDQIVVEISTEDTTIDDNLNTADITKVQTNKFDQFIDGKFLIDNYTNIYDAEGHLRGNSIAPDSDYAYLKVIDGQFLVADKRTSESKYKTQLLSYSLTGRINPDRYYIAPFGTKFHHDITLVGDQLYTLTSSVSSHSRYSDSLKESLLTVYDLDGNKQKTIDFSDYFRDSESVVNQGANANDVHFNSLDYDQTTNTLIIDSRSYSAIFGYSLDSNQFIWMVDNPETVGTDMQNILLSPIGEMEYSSGQHTAFVANDYLPTELTSDGRLYISIFDNRQCLDSDYSELTKSLMEEPDLDACSNIEDLKSRAILYAIDPVAMTVETIDTIDFTTYSSFKGGFNLLDNNYKETYVANATSYELYDEQNELVGTIDLHTSENNDMNEDKPFLYRANTFTTEEMQSFVEIN